MSFSCLSPEVIAVLLIVCSVVPYPLFFYLKSEYYRVEAGLKLDRSWRMTRTLCFLHLCTQSAGIATNMPDLVTQLPRIPLHILKTNVYKNLLKRSFYYILK